MEQLENPLSVKDFPNYPFIWGDSIAFFLRSEHGLSNVKTQSKQCHPALVGWSNVHGPNHNLSDVDARSTCVKTTGGASLDVVVQVPKGGLR